MVPIISLFWQVPEAVAFVTCQECHFQLLVLILQASVPELLSDGRKCTNRFVLTSNDWAIHQIFVKWTSVWFVFLSPFFHCFSFFGVIDIPSGGFPHDWKKICLLHKFPVHYFPQMQPARLCGSKDSNLSRLFRLEIITILCGGGRDTSDRNLLILFTRIVCLFVSSPQEISRKNTRFLGLGFDLK